MALCIPFFLWTSTSHMSNGITVPTSFVWHIHNPGVSSAPLQGHAPRIIFLPTTGSFFVFITGFTPTTALFNGRFPVIFCFWPSLGIIWLNLLITSLSWLGSSVKAITCGAYAPLITGSSRVMPITCFSVLCSLQHLLLWSFHVIHHLCPIIICPCCKNFICGSQELTRHSCKRLIFLQWIFLPVRIIIV